MKKSLAAHGFLLVEALIVVAAVTLFGLLSVRLSVLSSRTDYKSSELEQAVSISSAMIESLKQKPDLESFLADTEWFPYTLAHGPDGSIIVIKYYNAEWLPVSESEAPFEIRLSLKPDPDYGAFLYEITAEVYRWDAEPQLIADLHAAWY